MRWLLPFLMPTLLAPTLLAEDTRPDFVANAWLALTSDTFAAQEQRDLLYTNSDGGGKRERLTGGFEFAYRLSGKGSPQLWLFGQTTHGTRSAEVACQGEATLCVANGRQLVTLLRNSSSLEGRLGLRAELFPIHRNGASPASFYIKATAGFLTIAQGGDAFDAHSLTAGFLSTSGRFAGSFLEAGWGRNDVFQLHRYRRAIVNGQLSWASPKWRERGLRPFVSIQVDSDLGRGADSIQTSLGFTFDLERIF